MAYSPVGVDENNLLPPAVRTAMTRSGGRPVGQGEIVVLVDDQAQLSDTDDKAAVDRAIAFLRLAGGGTLKFGRGKTYHWSAVVGLTSNIEIDGNGCTLEKRSGDTNYVFFGTFSGTATGYGSSANNIYAHGIRFKGSFAASGREACAFALHHSDNVLVEFCTFEEMQGQGHCFDICGSRNITIRDNKFLGFKTTGGAYQRSEAIQVDISSSGSVSVSDTTYDGLPTINVTVTNNKFLPLTVGGVTYPAPNPLGSHSKSTWHENIYFVGNLVLDARTEDAPASSTPGWIHFLTARNLRIIDNTFILTTPSNPRVLSLYSIDNVGEPTATLPQMPISDVWFSRNRLVGFGAITTEATLRVAPYGGSTAVSARNIRITDNSFEFVSGTAASILLSASYVEGLWFEGNDVRGATRTFNIGNITNFQFNRNSLLNNRADPGWADNCFRVKAIGNYIKGSVSGSLYFQNSTGVTVANNDILGTVGGTRVVGMNNCTLIDINHNRIEAPAGTYGIHLYTNTANGFVTRNIISGGTTTHMMTTGAPTITPDNNLTL